VCVRAACVCVLLQSRAVASDSSGLYTRLPGDVEAPAAPAATAGDMQRTWTSLFLHACRWGGEGGRERGWGGAGCGRVGALLWAGGLGWLKELLW